MHPNPAEKSAARGRTVVSKPLAASAAGASNGSSVVAGSNKSPRASAASSKAPAARSTSASLKAAEKTPGSSRASSRGSESAGFKVTKLSSSTVTLNTTWTPRPPQPVSTAVQQTNHVSVAEEQSALTSDSLQVASQAYPWAYMSSTLDACFDTAEEAAKKDLGSLTKEINEEESELSEQRDRLDAERSLNFFEELGSGAFATDAPEVMKLFHSHGDSCTEIEKEAMKLAMNASPDLEVEEPLKVYSDMLDALEKLRSEAVSLQESIVKLTEKPASGDSTSNDASEAHSQVSNVIASCLPIIRARIANLSMAQDLIDTALENMSLSLRMESMGIS